MRDGARRSSCYKNGSGLPGWPRQWGEGTRGWRSGGPVSPGGSRAPRRIWRRTAPRPMPAGSTPPLMCSPAVPPVSGLRRLVRDGEQVIRHQAAFRGLERQHSVIENLASRRVLLQGPLEAEASKEIHVGRFQNMPRHEILRLHRECDLEVGDREDGPPFRDPGDLLRCSKSSISDPDPKKLRRQQNCPLYANSVID